MSSELVYDEVRALVKAIYDLKQLLIAAGTYCTKDPDLMRRIAEAVAPYEEPDAPVPELIVGVSLDQIRRKPLR